MELRYATALLLACEPVRFNMTRDKLKDDPIAEALIDIRFETKELYEVVLGRLSDMAIWQDQIKSRLPTADIPAPLRDANPQLRFLPSLEISEAENIRVRIGANVLSIHFLAPYPGWEAVLPRVESVIDGLFRTLPKLTVTRLTLRYINAFTAQRHFVKSVSDLNLQATVAGMRIDGPINLAFSAIAEPTIHVITRVISRQFFEGPAVPDATAVADVEVFTPVGYSESSSEAVKSWIDSAHSVEKQAFRRLLPDALYATLREPDHASIN
jgi:uncharacterized protein (TIGR04255 family)